MWYPSAGLANLVGRIPPPVLEKYHLFIMLQAQANGFLQGWRNNYFTPVGHFNLARINYLNGRHGHIAKTFVQRYQRIFAINSIEITFYRWCGASQQHFSIKQRGKIYCCIAGMITGCGVLLLVGSIMLFIADNQTQLVKRQEQRRPGAQYNPGFTAFYFIPYLYPFILAEFRMIDKYIAAKMFL